MNIRLFGIVIGCILFPFLSQAADFTVTPLALNLDVEKRDIVSQTLTITNLTKRKLRLYASVNEVSVSGDGILESFTTPSMTDRSVSPTSWFQVPRKRLEIPPRETLEVPITVKMNPKTQPGNYSVFVGFATGSNQPEAHSKAMRGQGFGTLVNLSIDKAQNQFLRLENFKVDRFVVDAAADSVSFELANPSSVDVIPQGEIIFYSTNGKEIGSIPVNAEMTSIPSEGQAQFLTQIPESLQLGKYKAFLSVEYGDHQMASVQDTTYFYVTPIKQLLIMFLGLLIVTTIITIIFYRRYGLDSTEIGDQVAMFLHHGRVTDATEHDIHLKKDSVTNSEHE